MITGYNGHLAKHLMRILDLSRYELIYLTTKKKLCSQNIFYWNIKNNYIDPKAFIDIQHIIHLAGFSIDNRWTQKNKKIMLQSRVQTSQLIYNTCVKLNIVPQTFISASAMGYYGLNQHGLKKEQDQNGNDWMANLCFKWEQAADNFKLINTRVTKLRLAILIDKHSGVLKKTILGYKFQIGLIFGKGTQKFPWIHINDAARFIVFAIQNKSINGVFNIASYEKVSYYDFIQTIQKVRYQNSILIKVPKIIFKILLPEKHVLLFNNIHLSSHKLSSTKFKLRYPTIQKAIEKELQ